MAEGPEPQSQLKVENQCPAVSHDDVSRKHNTDLQYKSGKNWHFIANFNRAVPTWTQRVSEHPDSAPRGMRCAETKNRALL